MNDLWCLLTIIGIFHVRYLFVNVVTLELRLHVDFSENICTLKPVHSNYYEGVLDSSMFWAKHELQSAIFTIFWLLSFKFQCPIMCSSYAVITFCAML